jgi:hypothetical protein
MSIFQEMYPLHRIESEWHFHELERMLSEAIARGFVHEIPVSRRPTLKRYYTNPTVRWFIEYESGDIYSLLGPGERSCGTWEPVPPEELPTPSDTIQ